MSRLFFLFFFLCSLLAAEIEKSYWKKNETIELSKDEFFTITLLIDGKAQKELYFRWTLYKNEGLFMHLGFDGHVHQFALHPHYQIDSFRLPIYSKPNTPEAEPYFMVVLKEFKLKTKTAVLEYFIRAGSLNLEANGKKVKNVNY